MSPHHTDQMSQWSQVSRIALCMAKVKVTQLVSEWVSEWQGHLLSCSGQLKKKINLKAVNACNDLLKFSGEILPKRGLKAHIFGYLLNFSSSLYDRHQFRWLWWLFYSVWYQPINALWVKEYEISIMYYYLVKVVEMPQYHSSQNYCKSS